MLPAVLVQASSREALNAGRAPLLHQLEKRYFKSSDITLRDKEYLPKNPYAELNMLSKYLPKNPYARATIVFVLYFIILAGVPRLLGAHGPNPLIEAGVIAAFLTTWDSWRVAKMSHRSRQ